jgi:electron transfer flavoprotein alpha subunit
MRILIITNKPTNNEINPNLLHLFGAATQLFNSTNTTPLEQNCDVMVIGNEITNFCHQVAQYRLVKKVFAFNENTNLAENIAPVIAASINNYTHVLVAADSFGKNLLPRIAGMLEIPQISEITAIISPNIFKKFIYAGNVLVEYECLHPIKLLTVRTNSFKAVEETSDNSAEIINLVNTKPLHPQVKLLRTEIIDNVDLANAPVIVTGGRSLGSKEAFNNLIRPLAAKLKAGVGATRAAVDAGYAHNDCQIGQTGKIVAPNVYLAIGISGAVQHIAGMKDSKIVITINTDPSAPIFEHSDYGLIADLFSFIPELISKI